MRRILATAAVAAVTLFATLVGGPAAAASGSAVAEPDPRGCPRGNFCIYPGANQGGGRPLNPVVASEGNWEGPLHFSRGTSSVFNNGRPFPGADHVQLDWISPSGQLGSVCLHYNPGPGTYKVNFPEGTTFLKAVWRGEC